MYRAPWISQILYNGRSTISLSTAMLQLYKHVSEFLHISQQKLFAKSYTMFTMDTALKQATQLIPAFDSIKDRYLSKMDTWCWLQQCLS